MKVCCCSIVRGRFENWWNRPLELTSFFPLSRCWILAAGLSLVSLAEPKGEPARRYLKKGCHRSDATEIGLPRGCACPAH
jgi:hypothetical protein